jgi:hypothetical protein
MVESVRKKNSPGPRKGGGSGRSLKETVARIINCLTAIYRLFGADLTGWKSGPTLDHWCACIEASGGDWIKFTKWKLASFYSVYTNQPLPPAPKGVFVLHGSNQNRGIKVPDGSIGDRPGALVGGILHRWLRARLASWTLEERLEFLFSIKRGSAKGMPRASREYLYKSAKATVDKLTTQKPAVPMVSLMKWSDFDESDVKVGAIDRPMIERELVRTVDELFEGKVLKMDDIYEPFFPSTSANYIRSRKDGGAVTEIIDLIRDADLCLDTGVGLFAGEKGMSGIKWGIVMDGEAGEFVSPGRMMWVDDGELRSGFVKLYDVLRNEAENEEPVVSPVALPEALKVRVISKGPPFLNTFLKPIQRFCWKVLADHPAFLVNRGVSEWALQNRLGAKLGKYVGYLSGDYSGATDELLPWVSECIVRAIGKRCNFSPLLVELMLRSLTGHVFEDGRPQRNGQLMGSITSFPILCIANAALCRFSYEIGEALKFCSLKRWPGLINGDDIVMRCRSRTRDFWAKITGFAGLLESVGKTYYSREFLEMNSRIFLRLAEGEMRADPDADRVTHRMCFLRAVGFVNLGLLYGVKRSGLKVGRADLYGDDSLGSRARDLVDSSPQRMRDVVMESFVRANFKLLSSLKVPWYFPEWLGGLGLPTWFDRFGEYHGPSMQDVAIARQIIRGWRLRRPSRLSNAEWKVRQLVQQRIGFEPIPVEDTEENDALIRDSQRFFGECCVSLLFSNDIEIKHLKKELSEGHKGKGYTRSYNHNRKLWAFYNVPGREVKNVRASEMFRDVLVPLVDVYDVSFLKQESDQPLSASQILGGQLTSSSRKRVNRILKRRVAHNRSSEHPEGAASSPPLPWEPIEDPAYEGEGRFSVIE